MARAKILIAEDNPEGLELQTERTALRLPFPQRVRSPGVLRAVLKQLADQARAAA